MLRLLDPHLSGDYDNEDAFLVEVGHKTHIILKRHFSQFEGHDVVVTKVREGDTRPDIIRLTMMINGVEIPEVPYYNIICKTYSDKVRTIINQAIKGNKK